MPEQKHAITHFEQTSPHTILMDPKGMAILARPELFRRVNHARMNKKLTEKAIYAVKDLSFLTKHLPDSYKRRFLTSKEFRYFLDSLFASSSVADRKLPGYSINLVAEMFEHSYKALIKAAPVEFRPELDQRMKQFIALMSAITRFVEREKLDVHIPKLAIDNDLPFRQDELHSKGQNS